MQILSTSFKNFKQNWLHEIWISPEIYSETTKHSFVQIVFKPGLARGDSLVDDKFKWFRTVDNGLHWLVLVELPWNAAGNQGSAGFTWDVRISLSGRHLETQTLSALAPRVNGTNPIFKMHITTGSLATARIIHRKKIQKDLGPSNAGSTDRKKSVPITLALSYCCVCGLSHSMCPECPL